MYIEEAKLSFAAINANMAHTCGNITSIVAEEFKAHFPKSYFKHEHVNTSLAVKQFSKIKRMVDFKQPKPILAYQPRILIEKQEPFSDMYRRLYGTNIYDLLRPDYYSNIKFFKDEKKKIYIDFSIERLKMSFEFNIIVSSEYQQYNVAAHMSNTFRIEHPYYINAGRGATVETLIPESIINQLSVDSGIPILDENNNIENFLTYLNTISMTPISFKFQPATGIYRFFMVNTTNILMTYSSFSVSDGEKDGDISDSFPLSLQLDIEFNYPNMFFYLSPNKRLVEIDSKKYDDLGLESDKVHLFYTMQRTTIHTRDEFNNELLFSMIFDVDTSDKLSIDTIDIKSIFNSEQLEVIDYLKTSDIKLCDKLFNLHIYEDGNRKAIEDYYIDWNTFELVVRNINDKFTYRLACYINNKIMNDYKISKHKY